MLVVMGWVLASRAASAQPAVADVADAGSHAAAGVDVGAEPDAGTTAALTTLTESDAGTTPAPSEATVAQAPMSGEAPRVRVEVPAPYSLPWQLRGVIPVTSARLDTTFAAYGYRAPDGATANAWSIVTSLSASYKFSAQLSALVRLAVAHDSGSAMAAAPVEGATVFANPFVGLHYGRKVSDVRWSMLLGTTVPVASGGGYPRDASTLPSRNTLTAAMRNRSAMDNALFAADDLTPVLGFDVAWVARDVTVQVEATFFFLNRVRVGAGIQPEAFKLNSTYGLHLGYFIIPKVSVGAELRYQRWLVPPNAIKNATTGSAWEGVSQATAALGVRGHFKLSPTVWVRPGLSYTRAFDDPMAAAGYNVVQLDIPFVF